MLDDVFIQKPKTYEIGYCPTKKFGSRYWKTPCKLEYGCRVAHPPDDIISIHNKIFVHPPNP